MTNPAQEVQRLGQSVWYDNMRRGLIESGELQRLIDLGVSGLTSNPTIFEKAIAGSTDYDEALLGLALKGKSPQQVFEALAIEDIQATADLLRPVYQRTGGADGYASLEVSPHLAHDTAATIAAAAQGTNGANAAMVYGTDGGIAPSGLKVLEDDKGVQPVYQPAPIIREEVLNEYPQIEELLAPVFEALTLETLQDLNGRVQVGGEAASAVATDFLTSNGFLS